MLDPNPAGEGSQPGTRSAAALQRDLAAARDTTDANATARASPWLHRALPPRLLEAARRVLQVPGTEASAPATASHPTPQARPGPSVEVYLLSPFRVVVNDLAVEDWPNCKGRSIFKYLAIRRGQPVPKEVLMAVFWPDADPAAARNNLNVAIHGLRKALARGDAEYPFVVFRQGCYSFNRDLPIWIDAEAFVDHVHRARAADQAGHTQQAVLHCRDALATYHSPLLVNDRYEDWLVPQRQRLQDSYLHVLNRLALHHQDEGDHSACAAVTAKMLEVDACDEEAHRQLMRCYSRLGQTQLALRQYHFCVDALARELNLIPSAHTVALFQRIRRRETV